MSGYKEYFGKGFENSLFFIGTPPKKDTSSLPYQFRQIRFDKKEMSRLNINAMDRYYRIALNGKTVSDRIFRRGAFSSTVEDLNTKRFVTLITFKEGRYSNDIVKECKLKSPLFLEPHGCVFDMKTHEVVFVSDDRLSVSVTVKGNLCFDTVGKGIFYLPERKWLFGKDDEIDKYIETKDYLYVYGNTWNVEKCVMYRISKENGSVVNCNEIKDYAGTL